MRVRSEISKSPCRAPKFRSVSAGTTRMAGIGMRGGSSKTGIESGATSDESGDRPGRINHIEERAGSIGDGTLDITHRAHRPFGAAPSLEHHAMTFDRQPPLPAAAR